MKRRKVVSMIKSSRLKRMLLIMLGCSVAASAAGSESKAISVSLKNASVNNEGVFEGWGTSLCWWANRLGYSDTLAQLSADLFYGEDGLRFNIMRYNIGGGDDPAHNHITRTDSAIPGWMKWDEAQQRFVYNYTADHNQLNVLLRAVKASGENALVEVFSNSPPYFMTISGCSSGGKNPSKNNLREDCYAGFADYLVHVTDYIQRELGVTVTSLSPMNEPNTSYWRSFSDKQEGCHFDAGEAQSRIIEEVADALRRYGISNVIISASDETSPDKQLQAWHAYSGKAKAAIGRINTHSYGVDQIDQLGSLAREQNLHLWMSEVDGSETAGENAGEMGSALWFGQKIISDLNALSPSAWVMWQAIDNHISSEGYNGNRDYGMVDVNHGFWGVAVADHDREEIVLTQKYYGLGQFTRYIRPGSTLIHCGSDAIAAYDPAKKELVIVALNTCAKEQQAQFDLTSFDAVGSVSQVIRTSGSMCDGEHWARLTDLPLAEKNLSAPLKGNSITTFIISGVE
ncbi:MAG: glycoside hydrolase [Clostridia bacterium]|nr:glycoside hydrolase [Clostridia bacterium]